MRIDELFLAEAKKKIAKGETEEVIEELLAFLKPVMSSSRYDEIVMQSARLNRAKRDFNMGILPGETYRIECNKINQGLLYLLDKYYRRDAREMPVPEAPEESAGISREKIIGSSNLAPIAWLKKGMIAGKAVCKVQLPDGSSGTGFLIPGGKVMTNFHVLGSADDAAGAKLAFDYEADESGQVKKQYFYKLKAHTWQGNKELDYAIVEVDESGSERPLSDWGVLSINKDYRAEAGRYLTIVQHPYGRPKELAYDRVTGVQGPFLLYRTDTEPGSSGSPVFDENWQVVALHHGSLTGKDANRGTLMKAIFP